MFSGPEILKWRERGDIYISPFDEKCVNPNSYDVHLGPEIMVYEALQLDLRAEQGLAFIIDPKEFEAGKPMLLLPDQLYLARTLESTATRGCVPCISGKSSVARKGVSIHVTAGFGDTGFGFEEVSGHTVCKPCTWTLEVTVTLPVVVRYGDPIGQLYYEQLQGDEVPYAGRYRGQKAPTASRLYTDFVAAT
jgi:dCTP deaminase